MKKNLKILKKKYAGGGNMKKPDYTGMGIGFMTNKPQTVNKDWLYPNRQDYIGGAPLVGGIVGKVGQVASAYKGLNYFRPNPEMMYRGIGKEGMIDALESGVFRARPYEKLPVRGEKLPLETRIKQKTFDKTYYTTSDNVDMLSKQYGKGYIAEVPKSGNNFRFRYANDKPWSQLTERGIPISEGRILKKDWLSGYKEIPKKAGGGNINEQDYIQDMMTIGGKVGPNYNVMGMNNPTYNGSNWVAKYGPGGYTGPDYTGMGVGFMNNTNKNNTGFINDWYSKRDPLILKRNAQDNIKDNRIIKGKTNEQENSYLSRVISQATPEYQLNNLSNISINKKLMEVMKLN